MAAVLDSELTYATVADVAKWEEDPATGTLYVYGRATSPDLDTDEQVVSSAWSGGALKQWLQEAPALRVQHNPQRDPAGSGVKVEVDRDGDGAHWVKAAVDEPVAKTLVKNKHLRAFSIGIAKPVVERDMTGKARGGIITGGRIVEVSLVDSPANRSCFLELAKADKLGAAEFTGKVFGADDFIAKAAREEDAPVTVDVPKSATITFSPADLNKLLEHRRVAEQRETAELPAFKAAGDAERKVLGKKSRHFSAERRRDLARSGHALEDGCLAAETLVATPDGPQRIDALLGECIVLTDCGWEQAEVRAFGIKPLFAVTLTRGTERQTVYATAGHRWLTDGGDWLLTDALVPGVRVPHVEVLAEGMPTDALDMTKGRVASDAQQAPDGSRDVIVVDLETRPAFAVDLAASGNLRDLPADRALSLLAGHKSLEVSLSDAVLAAQDAVAPRHPARAAELNLFITHPGTAAHAEFAVGAPVLAGRTDGEVGVRPRGFAGATDDIAFIGDGHPAHLLMRTGAAVGLAEGQPPVITGVAPAAHGFGTLRRASAIGAGLKGHASNPIRSRTWEVISIEATSRVEEVFCAIVPDLHRFVLANGILTGNSYPIPDKDALRRAAILARSGHGNVAAARKLIARRAKELGVANPLDADDKVKDGADKSTAVPVAAPAAPAAVAKDDGGDEHEDVLHHDDGDDDDTDSDADAMDKSAMPDGDGKKPKTAKVPCPKCKAKCKPGARFCGKCGGAMKADKASKPTPGDGVTGAAEAAVQPAPEHREPDGPAIEALEHDAHLPTVPDSSVKTAMHLAALGVPRDQGALHDLLCPAYTDASVKAAHPGADLSLTDEMAWQAKALEVAATAPLEEAQKAAQLWTAARMLKAVTPDLYDDIMAEARKAFRDANPGPGSAPEPGEISAQRFNRPYISAGHGAPSPDHGAPHSAPVHPGHISAADFHRGLITAGHAADSPENAASRPEPVPAPEVPGVPSRVFYTNTQRSNARQAMQSMHDHIAMTFPDLCPMHGPGRMGEPPSHARPVPAGAGMPAPHGAAKAGGPGAAAAAKAAKKAARRQQRGLLGRILKGEVGLEDARAALGIAPPSPALAKAAVPSAPAPLAPAVAAQVDPDVIKAAVAEATAPLMTRLDEQQKVLDAIANQPDPAVTAYRSAALPALAKSSPAPEGPGGIPARAALVQDQFVRDRIDTARNSTDPSVRLQAIDDLMSIYGLAGSGRT